MYSSHSCMNRLVFSLVPSKGVGTAIAGPFPLLVDMLGRSVEDPVVRLVLGAGFLMGVGLGGPVSSDSLSEIGST